MVRGARAAYLGPSLNLAPHRNAAATVALALQQPFNLAFGSSPSSLASYTQRHTAFIAPGTWHHLVAHGPMAFVYLDALSDDWQSLWPGPGGEALQHAQPLGLISPVGENVMAWVASLLSGGHANVATCDARILSLVRAIGRHPDCYPTLAQAAAAVGLSPSRCQYLLRSAVGVPFRRYRLWRRMALVMRCLAQGATLTEAAHTSGFSSSAHLSTAFKSMFGLAPSALQSIGVSFDLD